MPYNQQAKQSSQLPEVKLLLYRTSYRTEDPSAYKVNGPVGIRIDIANLVYIKGTCIYADLDEELLDKKYEMTNYYLLNKPLSIKLDNTEELISKLHHPYWTPQLLPNGDHLIRRAPSCGILTLYKGKAIYNLPGSPSSSELIFAVRPEAKDVFKVEHLNYVPHWVKRITADNGYASHTGSLKGKKRDVAILERLYYQTGSTNPILDET